MAEVDIDTGGTGFDVYFTHDEISAMKAEGAVASALCAQFVPPPVGAFLAGIIAGYVGALWAADSGCGGCGATLKQWGGIYAPPPGVIKVVSGKDS